jgi:hypothetical protein
MLIGSPSILAKESLNLSPSLRVGDFCRFLDAEAEAALRQFVGAKENSEVGTRPALSGAIHGVKSAALHQPRLARKFQQPGFIRA